MAENPRIEELRRRLEREPGSRLFAQLAEELRKEGDHAEAIGVARTGLAQQPNYPSARMTLGRALFDSGDLGAARAEFESVLRGAPDNILASRFLAECLEGLGDLGSALLQYRAAQRLAPADKNLEAQIRSLEQKLSAPTMVKKPEIAAAPPVPSPAPPPPRAPMPAPMAAAPPLPPARLPEADAPPPPTVAMPSYTPAPPPLPRKASVTAEFDTPSRPLPPVTTSARPPLPLAPEPEPPLAPTLVEESFELEAPFNAPTQLQPAEAPVLPGRALFDELESTESPTLPVQSAPSFEPIPLALSLPAEPVLVPEKPKVPSAEPLAESPSPLPPPIAPPPVAESPAEAWRAPAPPRLRGLDETQEIGAHERQRVFRLRRHLARAGSGASPHASGEGAARCDPSGMGARAVRDPGGGSAPGLQPPPRRRGRRRDPRVVSPPPPTPPPRRRPSSPRRPSRRPSSPRPSPSLCSRPTLAELYYGQGALQKAVEVYEQLILREPANERHRARLVEIRRALAPPPLPVDDGRAARRRAIEAQIARLEQMLALVKRA